MVIDRISNKAFLFLGFFIAKKEVNLKEMFNWEFDHIEDEYAKRRVDSFPKKIPFHLGYANNDEFPVPFLALHHTVANEGQLNAEIDLCELFKKNHNIRKRTKLINFCKLMNIPWEKPKWYIVSYWG